MEKLFRFIGYGIYSKITKKKSILLEIEKLLPVLGLFIYNFNENPLFCNQPVKITTNNAKQNELKRPTIPVLRSSGNSMPVRVRIG